MLLHHFSHSHPLVLEEETDELTSYCSICKKRIEGYIYSCQDCYFCLCKSCAELRKEISHPFHPGHSLILSEYGMNKNEPLPSGIDSWHCKSCRKSYKLNEHLFAYYCSSCDFHLDIKCALLTGYFPKDNHFSHEHSLFFIQNHYIESQDQSCSACEEPISGPVYCCFNCQFFLHQKCFQLPNNIIHPSHRKHSLTLQPNPPSHPEICSCHLCIRAYKGFIYYCSPCEFGIMVKYTFSDHKVITSKHHQHPFTLTPRLSLRCCDACGTEGQYCIPYVCTECNIAVHKDCISLPQKINIKTHEHPISHIYFLQGVEVERRACKICQNDINTEYGCYHCRGCDYFVHVNCAMHENIFIQEYEVIDENQNPNQINLGWLIGEPSIIRVLKKKKIEEEDIAVEIEHFSHGCKLILCDDVIDEKCCDGCRRSISTSFYYCAKCNYILHKSCAELPRKTQHWTSGDTAFTLMAYIHYKCRSCCFYGSGLVYINDVSLREYCIPCFVIPESFTRQGQRYQVVLDDKFTFKCRICDDGHQKQGAFRYNFRGYDFVVDRTSLVLPRTARHKKDPHPLVLTHHDDIYHVKQCICDICKEPRDPKEWFYYCAICENSAHYLCVLGKYPFVKLGLISKYGFHEHPLTFAKEENQGGRRKCYVCRKPFRDVFYKCTKCPYAIDWECRKPLGN